MQKNDPLSVQMELSEVNKAAEKHCLKEQGCREGNGSFPSDSVLHWEDCPDKQKRMVREGEQGTRWVAKRGKRDAATIWGHTSMELYQ